MVPGRPGPALQGRSDALDIVTAAILGAADGVGGLVLLEGEAGIGKSRDRSLPAPLRSSRLRRVDAISPSAQEALRMAAVLGSTFAVEDLAALLKRSVPATATATHEAVRAGFLEDLAPDLAFRHDLIREALYEDLPRAIRAALHRDAADALADRAPTHVIAQHLALGAEPGDVEAVVGLRRAAAEAGPRDPATAVDLLRRAIDLQDPAVPAGADLRREYIDALAWAGHLDAAEEEAKAALTDATDPAETGHLQLAGNVCPSPEPMADTAMLTAEERRVRASDLSGLPVGSRPDQPRRLRLRSNCRRSFLVGRPVPGSLVGTGIGAARTGSGGEWSTKHSVAMGAPTRASITRATSRTRRRCPTLASTRSPTRTTVAGLAVRPLTFTWPPRQAVVAADRVLNTRTAHTHRSTRVSSMFPSW